MMLEGKNAREAADILHLSRNTTREWAAAYNDGGLEGLKRESPPGRTPRLSNEGRERARSVIRAAVVAGLAGSPEA
jgi:transposase